MKHVMAVGALALGLTAVVPAQAQPAQTQSAQTQSGQTVGQSPAHARRGAVVGEQIDARAVVETIDRATRTVLLRGEDGSLSTVQVGPQVRNLGQVKPGDLVVMRLRLGVVAEMAPPSGAGGPRGAAEAVGRTPEGGRPGAFAGEALRTRVTFNGYDAATRTVTMTMPAGEQRSMVLQTKPMQDFAATLKSGDKVDVTFVRSIAIGVMPAK